MVSSRLRSSPLPRPPPIPSRKLSYFHMTFFPSRCHPKCIPFSPKVSSTYDMFPKNHMKYLPHKLYKFPVQGYVVIISALCQTHIARISFFILLQLRCNSSINIWIVTFSLQLLQNSLELFKLLINHMGIILKSYLKT